MAGRGKNGDNDESAGNTDSRSPSCPRIGRARRDKSLEIDIRDDHLVFWGSLRDTYGEGDGSVTTIHWLEMEGRIAVPELVLEEVTLVPRITAYNSCRAAADQVPDVVGLSLVRGYSRIVRERLGGDQGCSHMTTLVLELAGTSILYWMSKVRSKLPYSHQNRESGMWGATALRMNPNFIGACHGWSENGEMVRRARLRLDDAPCGPGRKGGTAES